MHAEYLYNQLRTPENASVYRFLPYGPYDSFDAFLTFLEERRRDPCAVMFVAFDQAMEFGETKGTDPFDSKRIAGLVGLLNSYVRSSYSPRTGRTDFLSTLARSNTGKQRLEIFTSSPHTNAPTS